MQVSKDIEIIQLPLDKPLSILTEYKPFSILLFEDAIRFREGNRVEHVTISDSNSNSLFPRNVNDCDYNINSNYVQEAGTLCVSGRSIRIFNLGEIDGIVLDTLLIDYTKHLLDTPFSGAYIEYNAIGAINNTWAGIYVLVNHPTQVYACHYSDFLYAPLDVLNYCFEDASQKGYNVFVDSGLAIDDTVYNTLVDAAYNFGHVGNGMYSPMFFVLNTPFTTKIQTRYSPSQRRYNIIIFSGHTIMKLDEVIHGYLPVSVLYGALLSSMSKTSGYYSNASNKIIYFNPLTAINLHKKDIQNVNTIADLYKINLPYIDNGLWCLGNLRTAENNINILKHENNARIIVDTSISLIANLKSLIGRTINDNDELERIIKGIFTFVENNMKAKTNFLLSGIKLIGYSLESNTIKVDIEISLASSIEKIYLSLVATL
jgi:hypothetical protein